MNLGRILRCQFLLLKLTWLEHETFEPLLLLNQRLRFNLYL